MTFDNRAKQLAEFIDTCMVRMGLRTALKEIVRFIKLIPKLLDSKDFTKNKIIEVLVGSGTKRSILQLMKPLHLDEFAEVHRIIDDQGNYIPEFFKLTDSGIEFDPQKIDLKKYDSKCPLNHGASPPNTSSPNGIKQSQYDSSRLGCPASSYDLDLVINHFEKIINLVPDKKFSEWSSNS